MKAKKKKDPKPKSMLPNMQYYFKKHASHNELISIIDNRVMIKVTIREQEIGVAMAFGKNEIKVIKKSKYRKVSLEKGIEYIDKIASHVEMVCDEKIMRGLTFLMQELMRLAHKEYMKGMERDKNCCQGG